MMTTPQPQPTLLVFTLGASAESRRRRLLPERWRGAEMGFRRACLDAALEAGRRAGCRLEVSSPRYLDLPEDALHVPQTGAEFGIRLDRALRGSLARQPGPVVVVGSDVPGLEADHVTRALEALDGHPDRVVLGPSPDGGVYLVAASRPIDGLADDVAWCCGATRDTLRRVLEAAGREVVWLEPLADLDRPADLDRWLADAQGLGGRGAGALHAALRRWLRPLGELLRALRQPPEALAPVPVRSQPRSPHPVRGPPRRRTSPIS